MNINRFVIAALFKEGKIVKYLAYITLAMILGGLIVGCSPKTMTDQQVSALNRIDPSGLIQSDIWHKNRDEVLRDDPSLMTQKAAPSCYKDIEDYYGYPAKILYIFKEDGDLGAVTYMIDFEIADSTGEKTEAIYRMIFEDLSAIFGEEYSGEFLTTEEISKAIEEHDIGSHIATWEDRTVPQPSFALSVFSQNVMLMITLEA